MVTCPSCGSTFLRRDQLRWVDRLRTRLTEKRPYICWHCNWRGWFKPGGSSYGRQRAVYGTYPPPSDGSDSTLQPAASPAPTVLGLDHPDDSQPARKSASAG